LYKVKIYIIIIFLSGSKVLCAQNWETGIYAGLSNYIGDLSPEISPRGVLKEIHGVTGIFVKNNISPFFSFGIHLCKGTVSGTDDNFDHLRIRNLSFQSNINELAAILEFNFLPFGKGVNRKYFSPYTFIGIAGFTFQPTSEYNGNTITLNDLDTEGNFLNNNKKNSYSLFQVAIPMGVGFKIEFSRSFNMAFNMGFRMALTDYLDDVSGTYADPYKLEEEYGIISAIMADRSKSKFAFEGKQRGRSDVNDWYIFSGITLSIKIRNSVCYF
jgi:hypothetical protein